MVYGTNPNDDTDNPDALIAAGKQYVNLRLTVGDPSGSHSERYVLRVGPIEHQAPGFGVVEQRDYPFEVGQTYELEIIHMGGIYYPYDYDYTASVQAKDPIDQWMVTISDPEGILGPHSSNPGDDFLARRKVATVTIGRNLELFRDAGYTRPLDDWPRISDNQPRSPKYILGSTDPIYVQLQATGADPGTAELIENAILVTNEAGRKQYLDLMETGANTNVFRSTGGGDILYLTGGSYFGRTKRIMLPDEQVLAFSAKVPLTGNTSTYKQLADIMIDRGEYLLLAGSEVWKHQIVPIQHFFDSAIGLARDKLWYDNYYWYGNGYMQAKLYIRTTLTQKQATYEENKRVAFDAGAKVGESCADLLCLSSHGAFGAMSICTWNGGEVGWGPLSQMNNPGWHADAEFIILHGCESLGWDGQIEGNIRNMWIGNTDLVVMGNELFSTGIHAVLGYCDWVHAGFYYADVSEFLENLQNGSRVTDAWKQACLVGFDTGYGVVVRESNLDDYLLTPVADADKFLTQDSTQLADTTSFIYYYYNNNEVRYDPAATSKDDGPHNRYAAVKAAIDKAVRFTGAKTADSFFVGKDSALCARMKDHAAEHFEIISASGGKFTALKKWENIDSEKHTPGVTSEQLQRLLANHGLSIPDGYVFHSKNKMMAQRFGNGTKPNGTWCEGEVFKFGRTFKEETITSDRCIIAVRNNDVMLYSLINHPIEEAGTELIMELDMDFEAGNINPADVTSRLVYDLKQGKIVPVWEVEYQDNLFRYDAKTGETYRER
jgi:hypothetical protein